MFSVSTRSYRTLQKRLRLKQWLCVCVLLACTVPPPVSSGGSWLGRLGRLSGRLCARRQAGASGHGQARSAFRHQPSPQQGQIQVRWEPDQDIALMYSRLRNITFQFRPRSASTPAPLVQTMSIGLDVVAQFLSLTVQELEHTARTQEGGEATRESARYRAVFPEGESVTLRSAATGSTSQYTLVEELPFRLLVDAEGRRHRFRMWPLDGQSETDRRQALQILDRVQEVMTLPWVFHEPSLEHVECRFRVLAFSDLLTRPNWYTRLPVPGGSFLNFILLYRETRGILWKMADTIDVRGKECPEKGELAAIARLNLSLQILLLVGRITLSNVVLGRFDVTALRLDGNAVIFLQPHPIPRREGYRHYLPCAADYCRAHWPPYDRHTNAKDLARVLLYIWCPSQSKGVSRYISKPTKQQILRAARHPNCSYMPDAIGEIISSLFDGEEDAGDIVLTTKYMELLNDLQRAVNDRSARAQEEQ